MIFSLSSKLPVTIIGNLCVDLHLYILSTCVFFTFYFSMRLFGLGFIFCPNFWESEDKHYLIIKL